MALIVAMLIPWLQLDIHAGKSDRIFDFYAGNIIAALIIILAGRVGLIIGIIVAFQRILEYVIAQAWGVFNPGISRQAFMKLVNKAGEGTGEYLEGTTHIFLTVITQVTLYMAVYIFLSLYIYRYIKAKRLHQKKIRKVILYSVLYLLLIFAWKMKNQNDVFFFESTNDISLELMNAQKSSPLAQIVPTESQIDFYYIMGESVARSQMSLYGYDRKTTPYLDSLEKDILHKFENPVSPSPGTAGTLRLFFGNVKTPADWKNFYLKPTLIQELKSSGYKTVWATFDDFHSGTDGYVFNALVKQADKSVNSGNYYDDKETLRKLEKSMNTEASAYFIHMLGSHVNYKNRVPEHSKKFSLLKTEDWKKDVINQYDDTILYLDSFMQDVHNMAKKHSAKTKRPYVIWFVADHGQNLFKDGSDWFAHSNDIRQPNGYRIPFFIINKNALPCGNYGLPKTKKDTKSDLETVPMMQWMLKSLCAFK